MPFLQGWSTPVHDPTSHPKTYGGFKRCPQILRLPPTKRWYPSPALDPELTRGTALMNKIQSTWCHEAAEAQSEKTGSFRQFPLAHSQWDFRLDVRSTIPPMQHGDRPCREMPPGVHTLQAPSCLAVPNPKCKTSVWRRLEMSPVTIWL